MGRSVSYPTNAIVAFHVLEETGDEYFWWEDFKDDLTTRIRDLWPSFKPIDKWIGREDHAILMNSHAYFGLSEYCGVVAVWLVPRGELDAPQLADQWLGSIRGKFLSEFGNVSKIATMSNGESVYRVK